MAMKSQLEGKLDDIIDDLIDGRTFRELSAMYGVQISTLHKFLNRAENAGKYIAALKTSSDSYAEKAENTLLDAKGKLVEIQRARELAQHYRWMASKRDPRRYGDKLDLTTDGKELKPLDLSAIPTDILLQVLNQNNDQSGDQGGTE